MLDMGFFDDVTKILDRIKNRTNLGLFSATISQEVMTVSWMYQRDEVEITVAPTEESKPDIDQYSITVPRLEKEEAMLRILRSGALERVIVFCNTKRHVPAPEPTTWRRAGHPRRLPAWRHQAGPRAKRPWPISAMASSRSSSRRTLPPAALTWTMSTASSTTTSPRRTIYIHRIGPAARAAPGKGHLLHAARLVPGEGQAGRDRKICGFRIVPMIFDEYGCLVPAPAEEKHPTSRRRF